jgi:HEAT repeat protein
VQLLTLAKPAGESSQSGEEPEVGRAAADPDESTILTQAGKELPPPSDRAEGSAPPSSSESAREEICVPVLADAADGAARPVQAAKQGARQPGKLKRRRVVTEDDLRDQLAEMPEMGLTHANAKALAKTYEVNGRVTANQISPELLLQVRPDLATMPLHVRQLVPADAATLGKLSRKLHVYVDSATPKDALGQRVDPGLLRKILREEKSGKRLEWLRPEAVPVLRQLLSHEQTPIRGLLVGLLAEIKGPRASALLAERAVFDLSSDVRAAAVAALYPRPREQFRHALLAALRFPWPAAADHAAETLAALDDRDAVPHLVTLLKLPDPSAPYSGARGGQFQRQLVRVNHVNNCLMCHAPATSLQDPVIGLVPGIQRRPAGKYGGDSGQRAPFWVRADITFFRQDFAETLAVGPPRMPGRPTLRFDYLVRNQPLSGKKAKRLQEQYARQETYEQREAVLFALRELTGADPGSKYEDWLKLYPSAEMDAEADRLTGKLLKAAPGQRDQVLRELAEGKGVANTQALARAIPKLPEAERPKARAALVKHLSRIKAEAFRDKLRDADVEMRHAAAAACALRDDPTIVPNLIPLLSDSEPLVLAAAHASLKKLTGQDLGDSALAWQEWMKREGRK